MKRLLIALAAVALVGFGCFGKIEPAANTTTSAPEDWIAYENTVYGFALSYPTNMELRSRPEEEQTTEYLGLPVKFFASLRDTVRDTKPTPLASFYAAEQVTVEQFMTALTASDPEHVSVKETADVTLGSLPAKKVVSTTALGTDKVHYLLLKDTTFIIISQFLNEDEALDPVLATLRTF